MSAAAAPACSPDICWAFAAGARTAKPKSNASRKALSRHMTSERLARTVLPLVVVFLVLSPPIAAEASGAGVEAGAATLDGTYHVGSSAGQYASTRDGGYGDVDPHLQQVKNQA